MTTKGSDLARNASTLRRTHPHAPALDLLDLVIRGYAGSVSDFADASKPCSEFGQLIAEAFDKGMAPEDWRLVEHPNTPAPAVAALMGLWRDEVLVAFGARYALSA
jgi:hypothetical protein